MQLTPAGKVAILIVVCSAAFGAYRLFGSKLIPGAAGGPSVNVPRVNIPDNPSTTSGGSGGDFNVSMPGRDPGCTDKPEVRMLGYAWNAHMGLHFANGGPQATKGSLMCKYGVNFRFARQDMNDKLQEALVTFATDLSRGNANPSKGVHFVTVMGDGSAAFLKGLNDALVKIGPEYKPKVIGAIGYSRGEDKFMGPPAWKQSPATSRGGVVAGVLRDGDWNIAQKWLGDNSLKTNPDEKTYDPDALNWVSANDYLDAGEKYITGYSEERPVVRNGKPTGARKRIQVDGVVTWTPGDVNIATKKGGLVSIVSTKEYSTQMPCVVIGIDKWCRANRSTVENFLLAVGEGSDAVKKSEAALQQASAISAAVYNEQDAAYWSKYFRPVIQKDKQGLSVELGGSSVNNLSDMALTFGLSKGAANLYGAVYRVFGDLVVAQYPDIVPNYPPVEEILDTSYVSGAIKRVGAVVVKHDSVVLPAAPRAGVAGRTISTRSWNIPFESGRAVFNPAAIRDLERLKRDLLVAQNLMVEVHGHTDNVGNSQTNQALSESRGFAVKKWLEKTAPANFPAGRVKVYAHGQTQPAVPNATPQGRARNRRVEIVLKAV